MKTLVIYYSRTGTTKILAQTLSDKLGADIYEIIDLKDRSGAMGWIIAGRDAMKKTLTEIKPIDIDLTAYDLVVIGTPVWAGTFASAIRTFIDKHSNQFKKIGFFTTQGGDGFQRWSEEVSSLFGDKLSVKEFFLTKDVKSGNIDKKITEFINKLS